MADRTSITKIMYGWTKWGGANHGIVKEKLEEWYCQGCGKKQRDGLPSYMIPIDDVDGRDFVRVCSNCEHLLWINKARKTFQVLKKHIELQREKGFW